LAPVPLVIILVVAQNERAAEKDDVWAPWDAAASSRRSPRRRPDINHARVVAEISTPTFAPFARDLRVLAFEIERQLPGTMNSCAPGPPEVAEDGMEIVL